MSSGPLIAVPTYHLERGRVDSWDTGAYGVPDLYVEALRRAGARAALVPPDDDAGAEEILAAFDGLLLIGGGDVDPARYRKQLHPDLYGVDPVRDAFELALLSAADRLGTPTLAICRGAQVMNVAFGGTLHQHLPDIAGLIDHRGETYGVGTVHDVDVVPETRLRATVAAPTIRCPSHHHQGIDRLGDALAPAARSEDGLIEAIERTDGWMVGVQWHPEETAADDDAQQSLFDALALLAREGIPGTPTRKERRTRAVEIVDYDSAWPKEFERERTRIAEALGDVAVRIEHVGSTAVPGLAAKPVIDIQVSTRSMEPRRIYVEPLLALGYRHALDPIAIDHEYFSHDVDGVRGHHVHVCLLGGEWERRHLEFRDALRRDPTIVSEYERLKRRLAELFPTDVCAYVEGKTEFVRTIEEAALRDTSSA